MTGKLGRDWIGTVITVSLNTLEVIGSLPPVKAEE
jgi:hypothetical protein